MKKILLTRPKKLSKKIAKNLAKKNISSLIQPLFSVSQIKYLQPVNQKLQAILITSCSAIFALKKLQIQKDILILAVGNKTALKVKKLGYKDVIFANNSAVLLLNLALEKLSRNSGLILYLSGEKITLNLAEELKNRSFLTQRIVVYKTIECQEFSLETIEEITNKNISEVWIYSKNSLEIFYKLAQKHNLLGCLNKIKILCLSQEIANLANELGFLKTGIIEC
jgi:uroporphyrinogen-III synthase